MCTYIYLCTYICEDPISTAELLVFKQKAVKFQKCVPKHYDIIYSLLHVIIIMLNNY